MYKFQHFRVNDGWMTVVSELIHSEFENRYPIGFQFAVSFCSPKDTFNKKHGRELAIGRLVNNSREFSRIIPIRSNQKPDYFSLRSLLLSTVAATMEVPRWATNP